MEREIVIGTRGSDLALWQAYFVQDLLKQTGVSSRLNIIKTKGDRIQDVSFSKLEGKGFFTKEIEEALLGNQCDVAIHSFKDLETTDPDGLHICCMPQRTVSHDVLIMDKSFQDIRSLGALPEHFVVGTSSARRKNQWLDLAPKTQVKDLRGNVPTRIQKLREGDYNGIILAAAGVTRLDIDLSDFCVLNLAEHDFVSAPAQGALGLQIRNNDTTLKDVLLSFHQSADFAMVQVEREILRHVNGGCHVPLGVKVERNTQEGYNMSVSFALTEEVARNVLHVQGKPLQELEKLGKQFVDQCRGRY